jgi:uncharacterized repeat protein (TIGR01451 family)
MRVGTNLVSKSVIAVAAVAVATLGLAAPASGAPTPGQPDASKLRVVKGQVTKGKVHSLPTINKQGARHGGTVSVIVQLRTTPLAMYRGGVPGLRATSPSVTGAPRLSVGSSASQEYLAYVNRRITNFTARARQVSPSMHVTHRYSIVVGGVSMTLPAADVPRLAKDPQVKAIYPDRRRQVQTEVSPKFIGAPSAWQTLGGQQNAGENTIIGVLDTGVWPEHPSLSDPDPGGKPYPAPRPATDGLPRACQFDVGSNPGAPFSCNNKLIAAYVYLNTYTALVGLQPNEYTSARDDEGHGTHTTTTAAGNRKVNASIFGVPRGVVSGVAPRAQVIAYRVCALQGCYGSDSVAAVQRAIIDGVDAINFSIGGGANPYSDPVSLAFLNAYNAGIFVAASAGNSGPAADTVAHREPWVTTVAASTGPRSFVGNAELTSSDGSTVTVDGASVTESLSSPAPLVAAVVGDPTCSATVSDNAYAGKVVVCQRGGSVGRIAKSSNVQNRGGVGMILYNQSAVVTDLETDNMFIPTVQVQYSDGQQVLAFLSAHPDVTATIASGTATPTQGDVMASFSSRGGPGQTLGISKPDVTAPGVQILAGMTPTPASVDDGAPGQLFQSIAGTSMASPHVAGAGLLLTALHPTWTPGQIHSALMTSAVRTVVKEDGTTPANAFDDGSGRISLKTAKDPLFTIDETGAAYVALQNHLQDANYPSVYVPSLPGRVSVTRTLTSVSGSSQSYRLSATSTSPDLKVSVSPSAFTLAPGAQQTITITADGKDLPLGQTRFGSVRVKVGTRISAIPVTVVRGQASVAVDKTCSPDPVAVGDTVTCTVTMSNNGAADATVDLVDRSPSSMRVVPGSVDGGSVTYNVVEAHTTIPGKQPPSVDASYSPGSTFGYLPLSAFGTPPIAGVGDETIVNFNVPAFTVSGETYTRLGVVSNGYVVLGGGTGADVNFINQVLPNPAAPNNVLAPFWTDLNPAAGGAIRISTLTDGVDTWLVVDYDQVAEFSNTAKRHSFEIWIGVTPGSADDVWMTYGPNNGNGDGGFTTVGVENPNGTQGVNLYADGTGQLPVEGDEVVVTGTPGSVSSATVTYQAVAKRAGPYVNYAEVTGDTFAGTVIARFGGVIQ